ncbi:hypothetical protein CLOM_g14093 [Closterium sp. NIES-68]|nr:hypothetical protein CLOM_g14093 [Closterium sp. NIES-68]
MASSNKLGSAAAAAAAPSASAAGAAGTRYRAPSAGPGPSVAGKVIPVTAEAEILERAGCCTGSRKRDHMLDSSAAASAAAIRSDLPSAAGADSCKYQGQLEWEMKAAEAVAGLERLANETLGDGLGSKYALKLRAVRANFKSGECLSRRFILGELQPSVVLSMSPEELKDGLTRREKALMAPPATTRPGRSDFVQWVGMRCSQCALRGNGK